MKKGILCIGIINGFQIFEKTFCSHDHSCFLLHLLQKFVIMLEHLDVQSDLLFLSVTNLVGC